MSFYLDHVTRRCLWLTRTPIGPWVSNLIAAGLALDRLSLLGAVHVQVHGRFDPSEKTHWVALLPDPAEPLALEDGWVFPFSRVRGIDGTALIALLQCTVQGAYLRASDMDQAQRFGWVPSHPRCPQCNHRFATYDACWSHLFLEHGRVQNPFHAEHRCTLREPLL